MAAERTIRKLSFFEGFSFSLRKRRSMLMTAAAQRHLEKASVTGPIESPAVLVATTEDPQITIERHSISDDFSCFDISAKEHITNLTALQSDH